MVSKDADRTGVHDPVHACTRIWPVPYNIPQTEHSSYGKVRYVLHYRLKSVDIGVNIAEDGEEVCGGFKGFWFGHGWLGFGKRISKRSPLP